MKKLAIRKKVSTVYKVARETMQQRAISTDDRKWNKSFAESHDVLRQLADEAIADYRAGRTKPIDPDRM